MSSLALKVLLILDHGVDSATIEEALPPGTRVRRAGLPEGPQDWSALRDAASDTDLLILGVQQGSTRVLDLVEAASRDLPRRPPIVVIHSGSPNGFMQRVFEVGADDLLTLPQSPAQLTFALEKAIARRGSAAAAAAAGELITVLGPKGGTGKTLTSCNLAVALAQAGRSPVIVDIDLQFGDVGLALGLRPHRTIYDLAVAGGTVDADKVADFLVQHDSGTRILLAPVRPDQAAAVSISFLKTVLETLRSRHEFVIIDTPPAFTPEVIAAIDLSSQLCMVGMLDVLSLKDTKIGLQTLAQIGHDPADVTLVLNRADTNVGISSADVEQLLGRKPDVLVPSDRAIPRAVTEGKTIVEAEPRSPAARAFEELAAIASRERAATATTAPVEGQSKNRRRLPLLRKEMA
jgi:pilus assembly protein CpaE